MQNYFEVSDFFQLKEFSLNLRMNDALSMSKNHFEFYLGQQLAFF